MMLERQSENIHVNDVMNGDVVIENENGADFVENISLKDDVKDISPNKNNNKNNNNKIAKLCWVAGLCAVIFGSWWVANLPDEQKAQAQRKQQFAQAKQLVAQNQLNRQQELDKLGLDKLEEKSVASGIKTGDDLPASLNNQAPNIATPNLKILGVQNNSDGGEILTSDNAATSLMKEDVIAEQNQSVKDDIVKGQLVEEQAVLKQKLVAKNLIIKQLQRELEQSKQQNIALQQRNVEQAELFKPYLKIIPQIAKSKPLNELLQMAVDDYYNHNQQGGMIGSLVMMRKIGADHAGGDDASIIARLEHYAQNNQLKDAVELAQSLSVEASPYFKKWRKIAYAHLEMQRMVEQNLKIGGAQ